MTDAAPQPPHDDRLAALRILDAAANRAAEGLRVVEDFVRFGLNDAHLARLAKELRHDLAAALAPQPWPQRLAARDTAGDVGTTISVPAETARPDAAAVAAASFQRVQQALRSLEEFAKTIDPPLAAQIEGLRYRAYTLHKATETTRDSAQRLADARLYVLVDGGRSADDFAMRVRALLDGGVDLVQLRDKALSDRELLAHGEQLGKLARAAGARWIMNDRPDLARLARADGVHLGQDDLSVAEARRIVGPEMLVGVSTHSIEQARKAVLDGANYLGVGPTFPSATKSFEQFTGLELLAAVAGEARLPAFAIGGINAENVSQVIGCGMTRVAVSHAVWNADDPRAATAAIKDQLAS